MAKTERINEQEKKERERETERQRDRETERQRDRETERQRDREKRETEREDTIGPSRITQIIPQEFYGVANVKLIMPIISPIFLVWSVVKFSLRVTRLEGVVCLKVTLISPDNIWCNRWCSNCTS